MFETIILFCVFVVLIYLWKYKRPENFPPGPTPLPIIGNLLELPKGHLYPKVEEWSKIYGQIIGCRIFSDLAVFVTGVDNVLAALRKEEFQSRPESFSIKARSYGKALGIFLSTGEQWNSSRKFTVKQMRAFGKMEKENLIVEEINQLMETIKDGTMQNLELDCPRTGSTTIEQNFKFIDAYHNWEFGDGDEPRSERRKRVKDYVFYSANSSPDKLELVSRLRLPTVRQFKEKIKSIPNHACGSDHIHISCTFKWRIGEHCHKS
ncbi:hypothetical protein J6590_005597 [Homalodisca vitripennis]|nr:hypothetical protein J6590_005597 [Homalodisca vitripennis]